MDMAVERVDGAGDDPKKDVTPGSDEGKGTKKDPEQNLLDEISNAPAGGSDHGGGFTVHRDDPEETSILTGTQRSSLTQQDMASNLQTVVGLERLENAAKYYWMLALLTFVVAMATFSIFSNIDISEIATLDIATLATLGVLGILGIVSLVFLILYLFNLIKGISRISAGKDELDAAHARRVGIVKLLVLVWVICYIGSVAVATGSAPATIEMEGSNMKPFADYVITRNGSSWVFDADPSYHFDDGETLTYSWAIYNGSGETTGTPFITGTGQVMEVNLSEQEYTVELTVNAVNSSTSNEWAKVIDVADETIHDERLERMQQGLKTGALLTQTAEMVMFLIPFTLVLPLIPTESRGKLWIGLALMASAAAIGLVITNVYVSEITSIQVLTYAGALSGMGNILVFIAWYLVWGAVGQARRDILVGKISTVLDTEVGKPLLE